MCGATIQRLNYGKNESKQESIKRNFAVSISDTSVTLKQSQGHQIYNENVDPEQGYNYAEFEKLSRCPRKRQECLFVCFCFRTKKYANYLP